MKARTAGAWLIHHANKLKEFEGHDFDDIEIAGKSGKLLSALVASEEESTLSKEKVDVIAKDAGVNKAELPTILAKLAEQQLIERSSTGEVVALGVTTSSVLEHTATIFKELTPNTKQRAALTLAENTSSEPVKMNLINELLSDTYNITKTESTEIIRQAEEVGFVDAEMVDKDKMLFNGNLFKSESILKATKVLDSLNSTDRKALLAINEEIAEHGCITFDKADRIAGRTLMEKVQSIGLYDFSEVSNSKEAKLFVTKPDSFSKYGQPFEEDALDHAKALVASLSYGINYSPRTRGQISWLPWLLSKLIRGEEVGPAPAINEDYRYLEYKRVVEVRREGGRYWMRLLKKEVGELAYQVMQKGDATETALLQTGTNVTGFRGPEATRRQTRRKKAIEKTPADISSMIRVLRK